MKDTCKALGMAVLDLTTDKCNSLVSNLAAIGLGFYVAEKVAVKIENKDDKPCKKFAKGCLATTAGLATSVGVMTVSSAIDYAYDKISGNC